MTNKTDGTCDIPAHAWVIDEISAERQRQISEEGWSPEHDDQHDTGELGRAAACYALASAGSRSPVWRIIEQLWPWAFEWWKPTDPRRDLVKAGALIVAEIERLDRLAARETDNG
ncbi:hypothetical protein [Oceaniradius stylonematis]|uniref:hypothetical protein n=1 Tax=Oceaniradius stylonematis TaxID=2184161 RepID=UPI00273DF023|nr:hypothetical protein [Oceaniradius stylonematis]